jgi:hypothetical protein
MVRLDRATGINTMERAVARSSRAMTLSARVNGIDSWYEFMLTRDNPVLGIRDFDYIPIVGHDPRFRWRHVRKALPQRHKDTKILSGIILLKTEDSPDPSGISRIGT